MGLIAGASGRPTPPAGTSATAAAGYDAWFQARWGRYAFAVESVAVLQVAGILDGARVLDVGCGTGRFTGAIQRAGASVVGVDLDPGMLAVAAPDARACPAGGLAAAGSLGPSAHVARGTA